MKDMQLELMTQLAETVPYKQLALQVKKAIDEYLENPSEERQAFISFVGQMLLMKQLMQSAKLNSKDLLEDISKHDDIMNLFKENNN